MPFLNPFSPMWKQVREARRTVKIQTLRGDGRTLGGHFVIAKGGNVIFKQIERPYGIYPPVAEVRKACW